MRWKRGKFYEVIWEDIIAYSGWAEQGEDGKAPSKCRSFGWLSDYVPGKSGYIRLSATSGVDPEWVHEYTQHTVIPLKIIKEAKLKENPGD